MLGAPPGVVRVLGPVPSVGVLSRFPAIPPPMELPGVVGNPGVVSVPGGVGEIVPVPTPLPVPRPPMLPGDVPRPPAGGCVPVPPANAPVGGAGEIVVGPAVVPGDVVTAGGHGG